MLNEKVFSKSLFELKDVIIHDFTISHAALVYVLLYVVYKTLGRYVYFKPDEHSSKVNRTFLSLSLIIVLIHSLSGFASFIPILDEHRWFFALSALVFFIAPMSIFADWMVWHYHRSGHKGGRDWHYLYLRVPRDYYKTNVSKSERDGSTTHSWEEEGVESTKENIHSDALLSALALIIFIVVSGEWTYRSVAEYGYLSYIFSVPLIFTL